MAKKPGPKENFRVIVEPRDMTNFGSVQVSRGMLYSGEDAQQRWERDMQARCEEIAADIKRHADNVASAWVEFDQEPVCEHCGDAWSEDNDTYNGGCCEKDEAANPINQRAA